MTLRELLQTLETRKISIGLKDNRLFVGSSPKEIGPQLLDVLRQRRNELEAHFQEHAARYLQSGIPAQGRSGDRLPLSFSQQGLWLLGQFSAGSGAEYHMPTVLDLVGAPDVAKLAAALLHVIERHDVLRTVYRHEPDGSVWQVAHPVASFDLPLRDVAPGALDEAVRAEVERPFDLVRGLPIRASLLRLAPEHHVLLLVMHHIATDGWSNAILVRECCDAYAALVNGRAPALAALPIQYADYAHWQRQASQQAVHAQQLLYWQDQLAGIPDVHCLPVDRPRPAIQRFAGATHRSTLDAALAGRLRTACRQQGATLFMGLHAAFSALLSRYSGAADIVVGTPTANREQPEIANLIGFFVNTLVLRATLDEHTTFSALLQACRETSLAAFANQQLPFDRLVEALRPARSLSYAPLFQVMLSLHNNARESATLSGLVVTPLESTHHSAQFDLTLDVEERDGALALSWEYNCDLFDGATVARMADSFACLLGAALAQPTVPLARLPLVAGDEAARLLAAGRGAGLPVDAVCLHQRVEMVAARQPDEVALVDGALTLSYRELNRRANRVAHGLRRAGVGLGDRVALHLDKSHRVAVAMLGVFKAGAAYVPLEPGLPRERAAHYLDDSAPLAVLSEQSTARDGRCWLAIDALIEDDTLGQENPEVAGLDPHALAYIVYTSGSTGLPKGVMVDHLAMQHRIAGWSACFGFAQKGPVVLQMAGLGVDICLGDLLKALCHGGRLVLCPQDTLLDAAALHSLLDDSAVTFGDFVPAVLRELIGEVASSGRRLAQLEHVLVGSESWYGADLEALQSVLGPRGRCYNVYGQTESVIDACCLDLTSVRLGAQQVVPLGAPLGNTQLLVLGAGGQMQPVGVPGELYIGGPGLARAYLNRPELTAQAFRALPGQDGLLYRTGDHASWRADGTLAFLGRLDAQVKLRGFRIELGEIEAALLRLSGVRQATVGVHQAQAGDKRLVGYVVADALGWDAHRMRAELRTALPEYMVPGALVRLDALPLNINGKLDRMALPEPDWSEQGEAVAPRTPLEVRLAAAWAETLGLPDIGIHANFFAHGGDSIRAVRLVARCRQMGLQLAVRDLFEHQTIERLAAALEAAVPCAAAAASVDRGPFSLLEPEESARIDQVLHEDGYPLSLLQQGIVYHNLRDGHYLIVESTELSHAWSEAAFREALEALQSRHPILRTVFDYDSGERPLQWVLRRCELPLHVHDWRHMATAAGTQAFSAWHDAQVADTGMFDGRTPLWRIHIHLISQSSFRYTLIHHHAILDGWSVSSLNTELFQRYLAAQGLGAAPLEAPLSPYRAFVGQELAALADPQARQYWHAVLGGASVPAWTAAPHGTRETVQLDLTHQAASLRALCKRLGVAPRVVLLTVYLRVLAYLDGTTETTSAVTAHGRLEEEGGDRSLGLFLSALPVSVDVAQASWESLIALVDSHVRQAWNYRHYPASQLQQDTGIDLGSALFNYTDFHIYQQAAAAEVAGWAAVEVTNYRFLCHWQHDNLHDGLSLGLFSDSGVFDSAALLQVAGYVERALDAVLAQPGQPVCAAPLLAPAERARLLDAGRASVIPDLAALPSLHAGFSAQAAATPDALALIDGVRSWTYLELEQDANRLARCLAGNGVTAGARVGLCLERSGEVVVAILAVLKCGACYVPLDPMYPADRIAFMLGDAGVAVVLAQASTRHLVDGPLHVLLLDEPATLAAYAGSTPACAGAVQPQDLAYIIYTSGSTGQPKGVMVTHANVARLFASTAHWFDFCARDCWCLFHSYAFDFSVWEIWGPLLHGGRLVVVPRELAQSSAGFYELVSEQGVTVLNQTPSAFYAFIEQDRQRAAPLALRTVIFGGEALALDKLQPWFERHDDQAPQLVNMYGITETTVHVTYRPIRRADAQARLGSLIGKPIPDLTLWLLDANGEPVPTGVTGELCVAGAGVASGYLNRAELTAARFVAHPDLPQGQLLYRSGDLARYTNDGELEYLGRSDHQVKIRGFRIELGDIEAALRLCAGISDAVVLAEREGADARLVAYVLAAAEPLDGAALRAALAARLPDYMVPAVFVPVAAWPLTGNGKLDKKALPAPGTQALDLVPYAAPEGEVEIVLADIWRSLLGVQRVGRHDNFFHVGGHSLLAIQLVARLHRENLTCSVGQLYANPTPAGIAATAVRNRTGSLPVPSAVLSLPPEEHALVAARVPGGAGNIVEILPLTPLQEGILYHSLSVAQGDAYLLQTVLAFDSRERMDGYMAALRQVISRHGALRTAVFWDGLGTPVQVTLRDVSMQLEECAYPAAVDIEAALRERYDPAHMRVDLNQAPLMRAGAAFDAGNGRWVLVLLCHHLVLDHTTLQIVLDEVRMIMLGHAAELPPAAPYSAVVAASIAAAGQEHHDRFFTDLLGTLTEPTLPFGLSDIHTHGGGLRSASLGLPTERVARLKAQARAAGVSAASLCHLAWARVLATASNQTDVVFGVVLFGRSHAEAARSVGLMVNTLPFRIELDGLGVRDGVLATHRLLAGLIEHELVSLSRAQRCSGLSAQTALFSSLFNYRYSAEDAQDGAALEGVSGLSSEEFSNYPLNADVDDHGSTMSLTVQIAQPLDPNHVVALFDAALQSLVDSLAGDGGMPVLRLPIVPAAARTQLLARGRGESLEVDSGGLHLHFEVFAARQPHTVALIDADVTLSYGEVDRRAGQIATALRARGVGPGALVAVHLDRSWRVPVSLLGILKTGAAFLPIERDTPVQRIAFYLDDAGPACVLADLPKAGWAGELPWVEFDEAMNATLATPPATPAQFGLAYVVYTSGTTGKPKGVAVEHSGMQHRLRGWQHRFALLEESPRVLQMAGLGVDICFGDMLKSLCSGGQLIMCSKDTLLDPAALYALLQQSRATFGDFVPAVLRELVTYAQARGVHLAYLRHILVGSESWYGADLSRLQAVIGPRTKCFNVYGQTESIIDVSVCDVTALALAPAKVVPLGGALPNTQLLVLDRFAQLQPFDVPGELYIGGPGLALGYLGRAEQTAERFVRVPGFDGLLYRTGDFAKFNSDGSMDFLGRADQQIKIRGFRIELPEIEAALLAIDGVTGAAVVPYEGGGGKMLAAHIALADGIALGQATLRQTLRTGLPEHMIPTSYMFYDALPMLASGKVDRKALRPVEWMFDPDHDPVVTDSEHAVAEIWQTLLGLDSMPGRQSNFFELGGHSLLGVRFVTRCRERLGVQVAIKDLFVHATVWEMAAWIDVIRQLGDGSMPAPDEAGTVMEW